jgi:ComF family protein
MRHLLSDLLEFFLPGACAGCAAALPRDAVLCDVCDARLPRLIPPRDPRPPAPLTDSLAGAAYAGDFESWIRRFKDPRPGLTGFDPGAEAVAFALIREAAAGLDHAPDHVVPVPQHPRRLRARGFHPAGLLAREVARSLDAPLARGALLRVRDTPSQRGLGRAARRANVRNAFRASGALAGCVVLVDDVTTTGSTLAAAARALRRAGARRVVGVCAARTL